MDAPRPKPHGHGKAVAAIVAVAVLAALGGTYVWAYRGAETVLPEAARALASAETAHFEATFDIVADDGETTYRASLDIVGDADLSDSENRKMQSTLDAEFDGMLVSGEFRFIGDTLYARATKLPGIAFADIPEAQALLDQWFFVSKDEIAAVTPETVDAPSAEAVSPEEALAKLIDAGAVSFSGPTVRAVDGELVREYDVDVDTEKLADLAADEIGAAIEKEREGRLEDALSGDAAVALGEEFVVSDGSDPEALGSGLREIARGVSFDNLKIRTALLSGELRSVEGALVIDASRVDAAALAESSGGLATVGDVAGRARIDFSVTYTRYGEPVSIDTPAGAISVLGLVDGGHGYGSDYGQEIDADGNLIWADEGAGDTEVGYDYTGLDDEEEGILVANAKSALTSARAHAELYYDATGSYQGFCRSEQGMRIASAIGKFGPDRLCQDSPTAYAYYAIFLDGQAWCVDSTGANVRLSELPTGTSCL